MTLAVLFLWLVVGTKRMVTELTCRLEPCAHPQHFLQRIHHDTIVNEPYRVGEGSSARNLELEANSLISTTKYEESSSQRTSE